MVLWPYKVVLERILFDVWQFHKFHIENEMDFYSGKIEYRDGTTPEAPDWRPDKSIQCGNGLHLSPRPEMALRYNQGKLKLCRVKKSDFVIYQGDTTKVRCKKVEVIGDYKP